MKSTGLSAPASSEVTFASLGVPAILNAQGPSTPLGGSLLADSVLRAMDEAGRHHVDMDRLIRVSGEVIARFVGTEDAFPTIGAAAGLAIATAAVVAGKDASVISTVPDHGLTSCDVLIQKGHSVHFGGAPIEQVVAMGGGRLTSVGSVNGCSPALIEASITPRTVALIYMSSTTHAVHDRMVDLAGMASIARSAEIPLIVDAAAEMDPGKFVGSGASLSVASGGKVFGGPTVGFICGDAPLVDACRAQNAGIGRVMKVSKEAIVGLLQALADFGSVAAAPDPSVERRMAGVAERLREGGVDAWVARDPAGRELYRVEIRVDAAIGGLTAWEVASQFASQSAPIFFRDFRCHEGILQIDPRALLERDEPRLIDEVVNAVTGSAGAQDLAKRELTGLTVAGA